MPKRKSMSLRELAEKYRSGELRHLPVGTSPLDDADRKDLRQIASALAEVRPQPYETWEANFSRESDPKREIACWERMAAAYRRKTAGRPMCLDEKRRVFMGLLRDSYRTTPIRIGPRPPRG